MTQGNGKKHTKLETCDLKRCEGICCSDGAFLADGEEAKIRRVVKANPEHFAHLPADCIIDGDWEGNTGRKTAVVPYLYQNRPAHFSDTRCCFAEADGRCSLQTLAVKKGVHKWKWKPTGCWLFPLGLDDGKIDAPPRTRREDENNIGRHYPGFATFTPCGKHREKGKVWWIALKEEREHVKTIVG
jgi:Protein of unknown function (DUF3109)